MTADGDPDAQLPTGGGSSSAPDELIQRSCELLTRHGETALVEAVNRVRALPPPSRTVVVIGEVKRGKSSLVNSLLGRLNAAPVDVDITTSAQLRFVPPTAEFAEGKVRLEFPVKRFQEIAAEELRDWVTVGGAMVNDPNFEQLPVAAEISTAALHLPGVHIVDTPGVNGLNASHIESAVTATKGASVLLMVCDATASISKPELDFLQRVSGEIGSVVLAVTKTDLATKGGQAIVDENRRILAEHARRFAGIDIMPVSSLLAEAAMKSADPERAERAWAASGIPELAHRLLRLLSDGQRMHSVNAVTAALTAIEKVSVDVGRSRAVYLDAPRVVSDMTEQRARLEQLKARRTEWVPRFNKELNKAALVSANYMRDQSDRLLEEWDAKIDDQSVLAVARSSQATLAQITLDLEALAARVGVYYQDAIKPIVYELLAETQVRDEFLSGMFRPLDDMNLPEAGKFTPWKDFFDPELVNILMGGGGLMTIPVVGMVIGPAWGVFAVGFKAMKAGKKNLRDRLREAVTDVDAELDHAIKVIQNDIAVELQQTYELLLNRSIAETDALLARADAEAAQTVQKHQHQIAEFDGQLEELTELEEQLTSATTKLYRQ
jgi:predicted GTPase